MARRVWLAALVVLAVAAPTQGLQIQLRTPSIPVSTGNGWLEVAVTDAAGAAVPSDAAVSLRRATGPEGELASDVQLWRNDDGSFGLDFRKLQPQLGLYTLSLEAQSGGESATEDVEVASAGDIEVTDMEVGIESGARDMQSVTYPQPLPETLSLAAADASAKVEVAFTVRQAGGGASFTPHQALLRATHADSGAAAFFRAKRSDAGAHRAAFSANDIAAQAGGRGGLYSLALLLGDVGASNPIEWRLGQVDVPAGKADAGAVAAPQPEIRHVFQPPTKHPPIVISVFFAGLQVALFLGLLSVLASIRGVSLRGFPQFAGPSLAALGFHGGVFGILALYLVFWVRLSLLQLVPLLAVAGPATAAFGYFSLSNLASARVKAD